MEAEKIAQFRSAETKVNKDPDDGEWFRMAHILFRAIYSSKELDKAQIKLLLFCIHSTWGQMGRSSFIFLVKAAVKATGMDKSQVCRARDSLIKANVLLKVDRDGIELKVNKYPEKWDLDIVKGIRDADTERRRKTVDGSTTNESVDGSTTKTLTDPQQVVDGSTTLTKLNEASLLDPGDPIDNTLIDKRVDNPPNPPGGSDAVFAIAWSEYPKRAGGNSRANAKKAWDARLRQGIRPEDLLDAVRRYRKFCEATEKIGTEKVKQAQTFFGPGEWYLEDYALPSDYKPKKETINPFDLSRLTGE